MIGGIGSGNYSVQTGSNPARERADAVRAPAATPEKKPDSVRQDLASSARAPVPEPVLIENPERRIEARRAAEDVRLERFRADEIPLQASRALTAFADVASAGQEFEGGAPLAGIDVLV